MQAKTFRMSAGEVCSTQGMRAVGEIGSNKAEFPKWSSTNLGTPLTIMNTRSAPVRSLDSAKSVGAQWKVRALSTRSSRLNGPCERDRSTGKSVFKEAFVIRAVLDYGI